MYHNFANLFSQLSESTFYKEISKFQLKSEFQHKGNKQTKKIEFSAKYCVFFAGTDSENKII